MTMISASTFGAYAEDRNKTQEYGLGLSSPRRFGAESKAAT
jgi:hypothetical protein